MTTFAADTTILVVVLRILRPYIHLTLRWPTRSTGFRPVLFRKHHRFHASDALPRICICRRAVTIQVASTWLLLMARHTSYPTISIRWFIVGSAAATVVKK